jgi:molybdopterin-guanine dinucleotide biosynthesis protein A
VIEMTAVILSGGFSSRMNYNNKAFLEIRGEKLIEIILKKVSRFKEVIIVSNNPEEYEYLGVKVIKDIIPQKGPMSGIHSGLTHARYDHCVVLPCDMPSASPEFLEYLASLAEGYDVVVPRINGRYEPLCSVYGKNCIPHMEENLKQGAYKLGLIFPKVKVREVYSEEILPYGDPDFIFANINDPQAYSKFLSNQGSSHL